MNVLDGFFFMLFSQGARGCANPAASTEQNQE
jgi:hypothetical protein